MEKIVIGKSFVEDSKETPSMIMGGDVYIREDGQRIRVIGIKDGVVIYSLEKDGRPIGSKEKERDCDVFVEMLGKHGFKKTIENVSTKKIDEPGKGDGPYSLREKIVERVGDKQEEINEAVYEKIARNQLPEKIEDLYEGENKHKLAKAGEDGAMESFLKREYGVDFEKIKKEEKEKKEKEEGYRMEAFIKNNSEGISEKSKGNGDIGDDKITTETVVVGGKKPETMTQEEIDAAAEEEMASRAVGYAGERAEIDGTQKVEIGNDERIDRAWENLVSVEGLTPEEREQKLAMFQKAVENSRNNYARKNYESTNAISKLKRVLRLKTTTPGNLQETHDLFNQYQITLNDLLAFEINDLKSRNLLPDEFNTEIERISKYYDQDEKANLYGAYTDARARVWEDKFGKVPGTLAKGAAKFVNWYRKANWKGKMAFSVAAGLSGAGLLIAGQRLLGGAAAGAGTTAWLESRYRKKEGSRLQDQRMEMLRNLESLGEQENKCESLMQMLQEEMGGYEKSLKTEIAKARNRRLMGGMVAVFLGSGAASYLGRLGMEKIGAGDLLSKAKGFAGEAYDKYFGSGKTDFSGGRMGGWDEPGAEISKSNIAGQRMGGWDEPGGTGKKRVDPDKLKEIYDSSRAELGKIMEKVTPGIDNDMNHGNPGAVSALEGVHDGGVGADASTGYEGRGWKGSVLVGSDASTGYEGRGWKMSGVETAGKGNNSVWKMLNHQLEGRFSGNAEFSKLNPAQKTYIIDHFKDQVAKNPKAFNLENIDKLKVGQKVDFSRLFETNTEFQKALQGAQGLSTEQIENIGKNNKSIVNWVKAHPGEALTSGKVEEVLQGKGASGAAEVPADGGAKARTEAAGGGKIKAEDLLERGVKSPRAGERVVSSVAERPDFMKTFGWTNFDQDFSELRGMRDDIHRIYGEVPEARTANPFQIESELARVDRDITTIHPMLEAQYGSDFKGAENLDGLDRTRAAADIDRFNSLTEKKMKLERILDAIDLEDKYYQNALDLNREMSRALYKDIPGIRGLDDLRSINASQFIAQQKTGKLGEVYRYFSQILGEKTIRPRSGENMVEWNNRFFKAIINSKNINL